MKYDPMAKDAAKKFDDNKPRYDLVPPHALRAAAEVFGFGAGKYGDRNWELGLSFGRLKAALNRHLEAFWMGEEIDPESNLPHLGHAMCCLMMLTEETLNEYYSRTTLDDRPAPSLGAGGEADRVDLPHKENDGRIDQRSDPRDDSRGTRR